MAIHIFQSIIGGVAAAIIWFIIGGVAYMNPFVAKIYKKYEDAPGVKKRKDVKSFLINTFVFSCLIQCIILAFVYSFIQPILPESLVLSFLYFGIILVAVKIIPRLIDMWMQTSYPNTLLTIELVNGIIGSFIIALVFALII